MSAHMANKKTKTKRRYPTQVTSIVRLAAPAVNGIIKADQALSRLNKRLYRQGRFYQCKVDLDLSAADTGSPIEVYALRDTWGNHKAYQMAFDIYNKSVAAEKERLSDDQLARWQDFRCQDGTGYQEMLPQVSNEAQVDAALNIGEFNVSQVEDIGGNTMVFTWGNGVAGTSYGIRAEYELKSTTDDSPVQNLEDVPYDQQQENVSNVEINQLRNRGNDPPYNSDSFGDAWVKVASLSRTPGQQRLTTGFFTAPCGFIVVTGLSGATQTPLQLTVKAGDYKGVHADSMLEV